MRGEGRCGWRLDHPLVLLLLFRGFLITISGIGTLKMKRNQKRREPFVGCSSGKEKWGKKMTGEPGRHPKGNGELKRRREGNGELKRRRRRRREDKTTQQRVDRTKTAPPFCWLFERLKRKLLPTRTPPHFESPQHTKEPPSFSSAVYDFQE